MDLLLHHGIHDDLNWGVHELDQRFFFQPWMIVAEGFGKMVGRGATDFCGGCGKIHFCDVVRRSSCSGKIRG